MMKMMAQRLHLHPSAGEVTAAGIAAVPHGETLPQPAGPGPLPGNVYIYLCMYVCMYVLIYIYVSICIYIYMNTYIYIYVYIYVYMYIWIHICIYI